MKGERGRCLCAVCGQNCALMRLGTPWVHYGDVGGVGRGYCPGGAEKGLPLDAPLLGAAVFWVLADRRATEDRILADVGNGRITSIYHYEDAAKSAAYETEKVWRIEMKATEVGR